jgi:hypothetical protein
MSARDQRLSRPVPTIALGPTSDSELLISCSRKFYLKPKVLCMPILRCPTEHPASTRVSTTSAYRDRERLPPQIGAQRQNVPERPVECAGVRARFSFRRHIACRVLANVPLDSTKARLPLKMAEDCRVTLVSWSPLGLVSVYSRSALPAFESYAKGTEPAIS